MIYVHIPFCRSFCTYCSFYSEVAARCRKAEDALEQELMFGRFADALSREIRFRSEEISKEVNTLYIGGGTPSVLPLCVFEKVLSALEEIGHGGPYEEFTVEVNPEDIVDKGEEYVRGLLAMGVNRISMGVQSFDDSILRFMNRRHDAETARKAYAILESSGVSNISIDLIFGLPQLSVERWRETVNMALNISPSGKRPPHISSYQLSVEPGSMLSKLVEMGRWEEASEDLCESQYAILCEVLSEAGYNHYEISNFAIPGCESRHNSAYWRHVPYAGFGPGAHSLTVLPSSAVDSDSGVGKVWMRRWNNEDLKRYVCDPDSVRDGELLTQEQIVIEKIMLGLRTSEGVAETYLREQCGCRAVEQALALGNLIRVQSGVLRIPESRFFVSDSIIADLISDSH